MSPSRFNKNGLNLSDNEADAWLEANATPVEETAPAETAPKPESTAKASEPKGTPAKGDSQEEPKRLRLNIRRNRKENDND